MAESKLPKTIFVKWVNDENAGVEYLCAGEDADDLVESINDTVKVGRYELKEQFKVEAVVRRVDDK